MATEFPQRDTESNDNSSSPSQFLFINRRCCFCIPYRWRKVRSSSPDHTSDQSLWSRGIDALKKLREWSEIVAGPRWKTFIRRFNRNKSFGRQSSKFQYDPLAYSLNFDRGPLENGDSESENDYMIRNFSSRYASRSTVPIVSKTSTDLDHGSEEVIDLSSSSFKADIIAAISAIAGGVEVLMHFSATCSKTTILSSLAPSTIRALSNTSMVHSSLTTELTHLAKPDPLSWTGFPVSNSSKTTPNACTSALNVVVVREVVG